MKNESSVKKLNESCVKICVPPFTQCNISMGSFWVSFIEEEFLSEHFIFILLIKI